MTIPTGHKDRTDAVLENLKRREIVRVERTDRETLPQAYIDELDRIKLDLEKFKDSQQFVLPHAFKELIDRVANLETITAKLAQYAVTPQPVDITPSLPQDVADRLEAVEAFVAEFNERGDLAHVLKMLTGLMDIVSKNRVRADTKHEEAISHTNELARRVHAWTVGQTG